MGLDLVYMHNFVFLLGGPSCLLSGTMWKGIYKKIQVSCVLPWHQLPHCNSYSLIRYLDAQFSIFIKIQNQLIKMLLQQHYKLLTTPHTSLTCSHSKQKSQRRWSTHRFSNRFCYRLLSLCLQILPSKPGVSHFRMSEWLWQCVSWGDPYPAALDFPIL